MCFVHLSHGFIAFGIQVTNCEGFLLLVIEPFL